MENILDSQFQGWFFRYYFSIIDYRVLVCFIYKIYNLSFCLVMTKYITEYLSEGIFMVIGLVKMELYIPMAFSLKDKRRIIKSVIEKGRNRFNISISEIAKNDLWKNATLGVVTISNNKKHVEKVLTGLLDFMEKFDEFEVIEYSFEYY